MQVRVDVIKPEELFHTDNPVLLTSYFPRLLADGDSWFSVGSVPAQNLIFELAFATQGVVVNAAHPGYTVREMKASVSKAGRVTMRDWSRRLAGFIEMRSNPQFDAIVLSGGGNDLIDALPRLLRADAPADPSDIADVLDAEALESFEESLLIDWTLIVEFIRSQGRHNAALPIFLHTYDVPTANPSPARLAGGLALAGPWLFPHVQQLPLPLQQSLTRHLMERLAARLGELAALDDVHVVPTLDTVAPAAVGQTGESGDWQNEIHLTKVGYAKVAAKLSAQISAVLGF